jgi:hypothetical protein
VAGFYCRDDVKGNDGQALAWNFLKRSLRQRALGVDSIPERLRQLRFHTPWKRAIESAPV